MRLRRLALGAAAVVGVASYAMAAQENRNEPTYLAAGSGFLGLASDDRNPMERAGDETHQFEEKLEETLNNLQENVAKMQELEKTSIEDAEEFANHMIRSIEELLDNVKPGGVVEESARNAVNFIELHEARVQQEARLTNDQKRHLADLWRAEHNRMLQSYAGIETYRETLSGELDKLLSAKAYFENLAMLSAARALNEGMASIIKTLHEMLQIIREVSTPSTPMS